MRGIAVLERVLDTAPARLVRIPAEAAAMPGAGGRWSRKQILGHLVDSAGNNHQRLVRGQFTEHLDFPSYAQEEWVKAQGYATESWPDLVNLWLLLNRHILHLVRQIPEERLSHTCSVGANAPLTLENMFASYVEHMEHHLAQIFG